MKDHSDQSQYKYKRQHGMMTGLMITVSSMQVTEKHKKHRNVALIKTEWFSCHDGGLDIYHKLGILHDSFNCPLGIKATCTGSDSTSFLRFPKTHIALILSTSSSQHLTHRNGSLIDGDQGNNGIRIKSRWKLIPLSVSLHKATCTCVQMQSGHLLTCMIFSM